MGRAQVMQAEAAGVEPVAAMNPILLKPTTHVGSQVIVNGEVLGNMSARDYFAYKKQVIPEIKKAFRELEKDNDIIVIEGAGSPAEINLRENDIVNMGLAELLDAPVLLVGDIDRGGVFAQLLGTLMLLEEPEKERVKGLIINKFRGDKTILDPGVVMLEERGHVPVVGVVPYMELSIDDEDSLSSRFDRKEEGLIDIASSSIPETYILPDFIKSFSSKYPDVKFSISHYDSQYAISEILNGRISFGFVGSKTSNPQIKYFDLINDELVLIAPIDLNIDNDNGYIDIDELNKLKFIMRKEGSGTRNLTFNILKEHNFNINNLNILAYVESNETIKEMVKIGLGVSFISYKSAKDYIKNNKLKFYRVKNINFARKFYFIYSKKKAFSPLENKFLSSLCEYFDIKREID